jgi:Skp family chaperone for outer membrane proteins
MKQIEPILDSYIKKNSISIVIDKKNMLGGLTEYDITKIIVEKLDKEFPSLNLQ